MQGPSSACNWKSSSSWGCSEVAASKRSAPSGSASRNPAAAISNRSAQRSVSSVSRSKTSKSSSRLSTSDTTAFSTRVSRGVSVTLPPFRTALVGLELQSPVENVAGDVGGAAAGGVGVGAQSHQRLGGFDPELRDEHAGGLADLRAAQCVEFGPGAAARVVDGGLQVGVDEVKQGHAGQLGGDDSAGQVLSLQLAGLRAEKVQRADVFAGQHDRNREYAPRSGVM